MTCRATDLDFARDQYLPNAIASEVLERNESSQRFGLGVPIAREALAANGNPEPEFRFEYTLVGSR